MNITVSGNILIATLDKEVDHSSAGLIRSKLDAEIKRNPVSLLVFDMSNLEFMDSSGIGLILGRYKLINSLGGKICVANPKQHITKLINMSGLHKILSIYDSVDEAMIDRGVYVG